MSEDAKPPPFKRARTSLEAFKCAVVKVRDILRSPGVAINGMDSMRHICFYILSRYMTKARVHALGVPETLSWEAIMEAARNKPQRALDCFTDKDDCLQTHMSRLLNSSLAFEVKHVKKHQEILEIIDRVDLESLDCHTDILGWVYEQHLKTGSSAARDLGQFFTDRFICEYMVALCSPGFKSTGVPESVCDPSMGTGGFLTSYVKHFKKFYADQRIDWGVQNTEIHGCDTDATVASLARLNLFMETGGNRALHLATRDSLYGDLPRQGYDIILANMPFGLKGLKHAECCARVKKLKIRGAKSEPLFLQLMMVSLNPGGRCSVVVPYGMLVNDSSCHNRTRQYLLDHFELKRVIHMKGQFFMNTGMQTSILFFMNTGNPTSAPVEFWDVCKAEDGTVEETMVLAVPRARLQADALCSFDVRRYQDVPILSPKLEGWVKLGDIAFSKKYASHATSYGKESGAYKFHTGGAYTQLFTDAPDILDTVIIVNRTNGAGKANICIEYDKCAAAHQALVMSCENSVTTRYVYYWLSLNRHELEKGYMGGNQKNLSVDFVKSITVPMPALSAQQELVTTLDRVYAPGMTELMLADQALAKRLVCRSSVQLPSGFMASMVDDVKAQMMAVVKASSVHAKAVTMALADVCAVAVGERITKKDNKGTTYPVYGGGDSNFHTDAFNREGRTCKVSRFAVSEKTMVFMLHEKYWLLDSGFTVSSKSDSVMDEYLWWVLWANSKRLAECTTGSYQQNIAMDMFNSLVFRFPPQDVQQAVAVKLEALHTQWMCLKNMDQHAHDSARFILDSYLQ